MITFRDVQRNEDLTKYKDWKPVPVNKYPLLKVMLNEEGKLVSSYHKGRIYTFIAKFERERGVIARIIRILAGIMLGATVLPLFSSRVRNLFSAKEVLVLRELRRDVDLHPDILFCPVPIIISFKVRSAKTDNQYECSILFKTRKNLNQELIKYDFLDVEIKDILDLLPKSKCSGNLDHFTKLQYLSV